MDMSLAEARHTVPVDISQESIEQARIALVRLKEMTDLAFSFWCELVGGLTRENDPVTGVSRVFHQLFVARLKADKMLDPRFLKSPGFFLESGYLVADVYATETALRHAMRRAYNDHMGLLGKNPISPHLLSRVQSLV